MPSQSQVIIERHDFTVDARSQVASFEEIFEQVFEFALLILHDRSENGVSRAVGQLSDAVDDLIG